MCLVRILQVNPEIEKVYAFAEAPEAYARMKAGHLRGKIVISMRGDGKQADNETEK